LHVRGYPKPTGLVLKIDTIGWCVTIIIALPHQCEPRVTQATARGKISGNGNWSAYQDGVYR